MKTIPKKIHYCWFGTSDFNLTTKRCIASWKHYLPNYELVLWNEDNFDVSFNTFTQAAYNHKKYSFVSDYVRMHALNTQGGIYLDTDVEVLRNFDELLTKIFFIGLEDQGRFGTSTIGCTSNHWLPKEMLAIYDQLIFDPDNLKTMVNVDFVSKLMLEANFKDENIEEEINNQLKLPIGSFGVANKKSSKPSKIYAEHLFEGSWNKGSKSSLSKLVKYVIKGGISSDINNIIKIIKYR